MRKMIIKAAVLGISVTLLSGCSLLGGGGGGAGADTRYVARDVDTLYNAAKCRLDSGQYKIAAALFEEVER